MPRRKREKPPGCLARLLGMISGFVVGLIFGGVLFLILAFGFGASWWVCGLSGMTVAGLMTLLGLIYPDAVGESFLEALFGIIAD